MLNHFVEEGARFDEKQMALCLKPTEACNFSCNFCSSSELVENKKSYLELEKIYAFLERFPKTQAIFVVGGDPLMMPPSYYELLLEYLDKNHLDIRVAMTTNLWDFFKNPEKWLKVFQHPKVEIGTSFQYGNGRQIKPGEVFTEEIFIQVYKKYLKYFPHKSLTFLAVISEENEHLALNHVLLAKKLNTQCRLVWSAMSGKATRPYPQAKLYKIMLAIWRAGLAEYEQTALSISEKMQGVEVSCPMSRNCDYGMRSINPDGRYFSCGPLNDDLDVDNEIDFETEVIKGENYYLPLQNKPDIQYLKEECLTCKMFQVCNSCRKHVKDLKMSGLVEEQCSTMKEIMDDLNEMSRSGDINQLIHEVDRELGRGMFQQ